MLRHDAAITLRRQLPLLMPLAIAIDAALRC